MKIKEITIENYRGIKNFQKIQLSNFTSIVGRNDSGKSIVLNAVASFLNIKDYPVTHYDFNELENPITIECCFEKENIAEILEAKIKTKIKKADGLEEFLVDILIDNRLTIRKIINAPKKAFDSEQILISDYDSDDFSFLYGKSDDELNQILEKYGIEIPVEGKGRNSKIEKIKYIKEYCQDNAIPTINRYIDDEYKVTSLLPDVELFVSDYGLEADTKFKSNSVSEIQLYLTEESKEEKKLALVQQEIENEMQKEATSVKSYMQDYVSSLNKVEIKPTISWKDAIKSVDVSFQFDGDDKLIPMSHKGTGYRRLFMVARFRYLAEKKKGNNIVYLIEEPETFLHPSAQEDLINAFNDLSEDNQILISTHSPVFVGATDISSVVLCKKEEQSIYETTTEENKIDFINEIIQELGVKPSFNLRDDFDKILFVEGKDDLEFYKKVTFELIGKDLEEKVLILPVGGSSVDSFVNISYFKNNGRDLFLILDSDKGLLIRDPRKPEIQIKSSDNFNENFGKSYLLKKSNIESYFHPRALERNYHHIKNDSLHFFDDDEDLKEFFKEKGINKKHNVNIFNEMTKEEWEAVIEEELVEFLTELVN
ncbi:MAG: hypothetical protein COA49_05640 [Bacteroidetes bacterium]|nr:MAG: hypothetical protein COA49_05640 [Bacteroidota bacterium]